MRLSLCLCIGQLFFSNEYYELGFCICATKREDTKKITGLKELQKLFLYLLEVYKNLTNGWMELKTVVDDNKYIHSVFFSKSICLSKAL